MREQNRIIGLIAWMFAITAAVWSFTIPVGEAPDEREHLEYAVFIRDHGRLPATADRLRENLHEGFQPPLYHVILGGWAAVIGFSPRRINWIENPVFDRTSFRGRASQYDPAGMYRANAVPDMFRFRLMRLPGVLFGSLAIWLMLRTVCALGVFGLGGTLTVLAASTPLFAFTAGTIGNDMPAALCGALAVFGWVRSRTDRRWIWVCALALALGLATKVTVIFFWLALMALAWMTRPRDESRRVPLAMTLIPLPMAIWSLARTFSQGARFQDPELAGSLSADFGTWLWSWATTAAKTLYHSLFTSVGVLGVHAVWLPGVIYGAFLAVAAVVLWFWIRSLRRGAVDAQILGLAGWLSALLLFFAAVYWYRESGFSMHSRLYLPFVPAILVGMSAGTVQPDAAPVRRSQTVMALLLGTALMVLGLLPDRFWNVFAFAVRSRLNLLKPVEQYAQVLSILYAAAGAFLIVFLVARRWLTRTADLVQRRPAMLLTLASLAFTANLMILFLHVRSILS